MNENMVLANEEYPIIGDSEAIFRIRNQIDFSADVKFPIFISGEIGTEKLSVARQIHNRRCLPPEVFICVPSNINDLEIFKDYLKNSMQKSKGGTLYFSEIDLLPDDLKSYLITQFIGNTFNKSMYEHNINLIVSCTNLLVSNQEASQFIAKTFGCSVPHLEIHIPSLRERKEDIRGHINYIIQKVSIRRCLSLDSVALDLLLSYDWPENLDQLQRVLCLLASYCESDITQEDVLALNLINNTKGELDFIGKILVRDMDFFNYVHIGLRKALTYLGEHYQEEITLGTLSDVACTSASHLSYLFRNHLNLSFKSILVQLRVRYAKQLIEASPQFKITDISFQSGFGDLSHFEKMFKRYVGSTPRQHRQKFRLEKSLLMTA